MSSNDIKIRKIHVTKTILLEGDSVIEFRDGDLKIWSDSDGYITIQADTGIKIDGDTVMQAGHQLNAAADGVVTLVKAGAVNDTDFSNDTNGLIAVDSSNGRIYFRYGDGWHYCSQDAGIQFPETTCRYCGDPFEAGEEIGWMVDKFMPDGAPHCLPVHRRCMRYG